MQARKTLAQHRDRMTSVNLRSVPHDNHMPAKVAQQVAQKTTDFWVLDVFLVEVKIQTQATPRRTDRKSGDDGDPIAPLMVDKNRRQTLRRPGAPPGRNQQESRLVDEGDVGTQPRSVFFIRGQWRRFQRATASSSRSKARRAGC